jgi:hypothetical protein
MFRMLVDDHGTSSWIVFRPRRVSKAATVTMEYSSSFPKARRAGTLHDHQDRYRIVVIVLKAAPSERLPALPPAWRQSMWFCSIRWSQNETRRFRIQNHGILNGLLIDVEWWRSWMNPIYRHSESKNMCSGNASPTNGRSRVSIRFRLIKSDLWHVCRSRSHMSSRHSGNLGTLSFQINSSPPCHTIKGFGAVKVKDELSTEISRNPDTQGDHQSYAIHHVQHGEVRHETMLLLVLNRMYQWLIILIYLYW